MEREGVFQLPPELLQGLVQDWRHFHRHPEISFEEWETAQYICGRLEDAGIPYEYPVGENGIVARIKCGKAGQTIAFRADIDGLKIGEKNEVPYKSQNPGVMHACGHDFHAAALLNFGLYLNEIKEQLAGEAVLIFQYAEEVGPGGAVAMAETGCLERAVRIYAAHVTPEIAAGCIAVREGAASGTSAAFRVKIQGKGGHSANPAGTVDALLTACQCVTALNTIPGRFLGPEEIGLFNIGYIHSGNARNIICDDAEFGGIIRGLSGELCSRMMDRAEAVVRGICTANSAQYSIEMSWGYPCVENSAAAVKILKEATARYTDFEVLAGPLNLGGEDFSYFLKKVPGCLFHVGVGSAEKGFIHPLHHPRFDGDEKGLAVIVKTFLALFCEENGGV